MVGGRRYVWIVLGMGTAAALAPGIFAAGCDVHGFLFVCQDGSEPVLIGNEAVCPPCPDGSEVITPADGNSYCPDAGVDAGSCGDGGTCDDAGPDAGEGGHAAIPGWVLDAGADTSMASVCNGQCVPKEPVGWSEPALLWFGPPDEAPDCPATAPVLGYEGHADLDVAPYACPACVCDPPETTCELPTGWSAADTATCPSSPAAQRTSFAAPDGWDGACTTANAIPAGQACAGGPCAQSLDIPAPRAIPGPCAARFAEEPRPPRGGFRWGTYAKACVGTAYPPCADPAMTCTPAPPDGSEAPPEGFATCIFHEGEEGCPTTYPSQHVFYADAEDTRGCAACGCGEAIGAACSMLASAFSDGACSTFVLGVLVTSDASFCGGIAPGTALGSKSATVASTTPATCAPSGGETTGDVEPVRAATFCCLEPTV